MAKKQYRVRNWVDYNNSLVQRGSVSIWFDNASINQWYATRLSEGRGRPVLYSDAAIICGLTLRSIYHLSLRATEGFVKSLIALLQLPLQAPDYTTLCKRQKAVKISLPRRLRTERSNLHIVVDATGLKVFGEGEWKVRQHGYSKRRTWRKLHIAVDESNQEIMGLVLTSNDVADSAVVEDLLAQIPEPINQFSGDGAYDKRGVYQALKQREIKAIIPPRKDAIIWQHGNSRQPPLARDENLRAIRKKGRAQWKKEAQYHRRSLAETAMFRFKQLLGRQLNARCFEHQLTEVIIKANILNRITGLGMPESYAMT